MSKGCLFVISAPSGAGKTTILKPVLRDLTNISFSVSHTTREPRPEEENGRDYFFVTKEEFTAIREQDGFIEWAEVHGNYYGTSKKAVAAQLARGVDIILDIDVQGARQIRDKKELPAVFIFISPPSLVELERRLTTRQTDSQDTIKLRMHNAGQEMAEAKHYDHRIVNDKLEQAVKEFKDIILKKRGESRRS